MPIETGDSGVSLAQGSLGMAKQRRYRLWHRAHFTRRIHILSSQLGQEPERGTETLQSSDKMPRQFDHRFLLAAHPSLLASDIR